ncbi:MAG: anti-sigma factor [Nitrosomonas sp. PRO4]|nr:anti-sigma factor [Nitrosomonas sp. PRO4]
MKSKISALMDGELEKHDVSSVLEVLRKDDELRIKWQTYHLIGDTLRQSSRLSTDVSQKVNQKLIAEPTVLSPKKTTTLQQQKYKVFAVSLAASLVVAISAWLVIHTPSNMTERTMLADNPNQNGSKLPEAAMPVMVSSPAAFNNFSPVEMNEYLFVHREFSPGTNIRGQITHINGGNEYHERYGR